MLSPATRARFCMLVMPQELAIHPELADSPWASCLRPLRGLVGDWGSNSKSAGVRRAVDKLIAGRSIVRRNDPKHFPGNIPNDIV